MLTITLAGRLGRDAELRSTRDGKAVCNFSVAVDVRHWMVGTTLRATVLDQLAAA